jgi:TolB-like protein
VTLAGAYEELERFTEARDIYERLAEESPEEAVRREAERGLLALARLELRQAAREALAREAELRGTPPEPQVVGVFPFLFAAQNADLGPLARALAELLTVDLSQTDRLRVVERSQIQHLLDELALAQTARMDPATAARSGRLVGAGRIVQGRIDGEGEEVRLQAIPVRVGAEPEQEPGDLLLREGPLPRLFELQKELALDLYGAMGIELTAAERERVNRRRTENLQALLYFGYGLGAADDGRLADALSWFGAAADADPAFDLAEEWRARVEVELGWRGEPDPHRFYRIATAATPPAGAEPSAMDWIEVRARFLEVERLIPSPVGRDALSEALGIEGLDREGTLDIVIRAPQGGE